jgi:GT2 family glycosyltransferase
VVIVNFCQWQNTAALVKSLRQASCLRGGQAEVVIVDNDSPPHRIVHQLRRCPGVSLRRWARNRGFARGVNEGCRLARGEWLLLLNPDISVDDGFLDGVQALVEELTATEPRTGIVGFRLRNRDGSPQLSAGFFPTLPGTLARLLLPRARRKYHDVQAASRRRVAWVTGCCLLVRRECLQDLGGLDESYFLYYEDVDLCRRARARGWCVSFEPSLTATHHFPLHQRPVPAALRLVTRHSLLTYAERHWPAWQSRVLAGVVAAEATARQLWAWWRGETDKASIFHEMRALSLEIGQGEKVAAQRRLRRVVGEAGPDLAKMTDRFAVAAAPPSRERETRSSRR